MKINNSNLEPSRVVPSGSIGIGQAGIIRLIQLEAMTVRSVASMDAKSLP